MCPEKIDRITLILLNQIIEIRGMNHYTLFDLHKWYFVHIYQNELNEGLFRACRGGHRDLAELMIKKGATDLNWGLEGACEGGHRELAEWMIEKGADSGKCPYRPHCHSV